MYEMIEFDCREGLAVVTLNRPDRLNAINAEMLAELRAAMAQVCADKSVRVLVITGKGRAFSAGADVTRFGEIGGEGVVDFLENFQTTFNAIEDLPRPVIAGLNGFAYGGGCELALACDLRVMAEEATIGVPEIKIGTLPGGGGTQRLTHLLPPAIAMEMICLGEPLSSAAALQHGLVNKVVPAARVLEETLALARKLVVLPPLAIRSAKLLVRAGMNTDLRTGVEVERQAAAYLFGTEDRKEGIQAFLQKRKPVFQGR